MLKIIYEDRRIVVAVKPAGVLSTDEAGGMPSLLREALGSQCLRTVHRLDAQTGGVMVFARSRKAASLLSQCLRQHEFQKDYLAVVHGVPQPAAAQWRDLLARDSVRRMTYVADAPSDETKEALLDYEVLGSSGGLSLVRVHLHTGRTHQIRVQFASRGLPLCGDRKYGIGGDETPLALWAFRLSFPHPETGEVMTFSCLPPPVAPWTAFTLPDTLC